jgi:hypothetical protein
MAGCRAHCRQYRVQLILEGGKVYQTDPWGTRDQTTGDRYEGAPYNYLHFEGQNPAHPSEQMREISSDDLRRMGR